MKGPIVNNCCFCGDLKKGNIIFTVLQIIYSLYTIFNIISNVANSVTQADIDDLVKQGLPDDMIQIAKDAMNIPDCKSNLRGKFIFLVIKIF